MKAKLAAAKTFLLGPILDSTGAAKTDEVVASIKVTKNGAVGAVDAQDTLTHNHTGHYVFVSDGGDFDTLGEVEFSLNSTTNAMAPVKFQVVPVATYDALITNAAGGADGLAVSGASKKVAATVAAGDGVDAAAIKTTIGTAGAGLTAVGLAAGSIVTASFGTCVFPAGSIVTATFGTCVPPAPSGMSTLTQTQVTGGAYDLTNATFVAAFKSALGTVPASGNWNTTTPPSVGAIATAIWQDATAADFTTASSIGKSLFTSGVVPGAAGGLPLLASVDSVLTIPAALKVVNATSIAGATTQVAAAFLAKFNVATPETNQTADVGTRIPQVVTMAQIGGTGVYYVEALTSGGAVIHTAGAAVAKSPATVAAGDGVDAAALLAMSEVVA